MKDCDEGRTFGIPNVLPFRPFMIIAIRMTLVNYGDNVDP